MASDDFLARFGGIARLYGAEALERFRRASVCVIGVGGVGSWTVEALARSGVGRLTLVDLDDVCVSNVNRQLHALEPNFGMPKVEALAQRARSINPECQVEAIPLFFTRDTAADIFATQHDVVVDAIDSLQNKALLVARCRENGTPVIVAGSAGGRRDGTAIRMDDLARATHDPLLKVLRKKLRSEHGFPSAGQQEMGVPCVFSTEAPVFPQRDGTVCATRDPESGLRLTCESGYGTATHVTGAFGFAVAAAALRHLADGGGSR